MANAPVGPWASDHALHLGDGVRFGDPPRRKRRLELTMDQRTRHLMCIGASGSGKSRFARYLLQQDIFHNRSFALIDAMDLARELFALLAERALPGPVTDRAVEELGDKVLSIEPALVHRYGSPGFNFLAPRPGLTLFELADSLIQLLIELWPDSMGPRLIDISRNALLCLSELGYTLAEMPLFLSSTPIRNMLVRRCQNPDVKNFFLHFIAGARPADVRVFFESSRNKWNSFVASPFIRPLIGQQRGTFSFDDIVRGKIALINLSRQHLKAESRAVLGGMLINALHQAIVARENTPPPERYLFTLCIDEAASYWTRTIEEIVETGRKYGCALALFFQSTRQSPFDVNRGAIDTLFANANVRIAFSLARYDGERAAAEFFNPTGTVIKYQSSFLGLPVERPVFYGLAEEHQNLVAELMRQESRHAHISFRDDPWPYQLTIPYVSDALENAEKVTAFREHIARKYYRPLEIINREITERHRRLMAEAHVRDNP